VSNPRLWAALATSSVLLAGACLQDPSDPLVVAAKLQDVDTRDRALERLSNMPLERARLAVPAIMDLYRETGKPEHLQALVPYDDPRARPLFREALDRWQLDRDLALVAVRAFADWKARDAIEQLVGVVTTPLPRSDRNNDLRVEALRALLRLGDARLVSTLVALLSAPLDRQDFRLHKEAALGLASWPDAAAVPALVRGLFLQAGSRNTFEESRLALARIGPPAVPALLELFGESEEAASQTLRRRKIEVDVTTGRERAAQLLGDLRAAAAVRPLAAALRPLRGPSPLALALVKALGQIGTPPAVDPLLGVVRDGGAVIDLRVEAAEAAASTGDEFVVPVLVDLLAGNRRPGAQLMPWLRARLLLPLARAAGPDRADEVSALLGEGLLENQARAQVAVARTCASDLSCYAKLLADPDPVRAEKAAWAIGFAGDRAAGVPALLGAVGLLSELPAARYRVYRAALVGLTRLADQRCQACRDKLRQQIEVDNKLVHDPGEKALLRETRLVLAYLEHRAPPATP
jgi:hypothetical protein